MQDRPVAGLEDMSPRQSSDMHLGNDCCVPFSPQAGISMPGSVHTGSLIAPYGAAQCRQPRLVHSCTLGRCPAQGMRNRYACALRRWTPVGLGLPRASKVTGAEPPIRMELDRSILCQPWNTTCQALQQILKHPARKAVKRLKQCPVGFALHAPHASEADGLHVLI